MSRSYEILFSNQISFALILWKVGIGVFFSLYYVQDVHCLGTQHCVCVLMYIQKQLGNIYRDFSILSKFFPRLDRWWSIPIFPSTQEEGAGRFEAQSQIGLRNETLSQGVNNSNNNQKNPGCAYRASSRFDLQWCV